MTDQLRTALAELVALKDLKDEESKLRARRVCSIVRNRAALAKVNAMRDDYNRRKPLAWAAARAALAESGAPARPQPLGQDARDAAKYRFLLARMKVGAVQTQLPLNRVAYWYGFEDCTRPQDADEAIEAQMAAEYEQGKGTAE